MSDVMIATVDNIGYGATSGAATDDLATIDIDNINPDFVDGTVLNVECIYLAVQGSNQRTMTRRTLLQITSGELSVVATDLIGSSIGDVALALATTGVVGVSGQRKFKVQATGIALLTIQWGVRIATTLYRPAD